MWCIRVCDVYDRRNIYVMYMVYVIYIVCIYIYISVFVWPGNYTKNQNLFVQMVTYMKYVTESIYARSVFMCIYIYIMRMSYIYVYTIKKSMKVVLRKNIFLEGIELGLYFCVILWPWNYTQNQNSCSSISCV